MNLKIFPYILRYFLMFIAFILIAVGEHMMLLAGNVFIGKILILLGVFFVLIGILILIE